MNLNNRNSLLFESAIWLLSYQEKLVCNVNHSVLLHDSPTEIKKFNVKVSTSKSKTKFKHTSSKLTGAQMMYTFSILIHHGAVLNCRTGTCNLILPIEPLIARIGSPK